MKSLLTPRELQILSLYYGHDLTEAQIGKIIGVTGERIRQIIKKVRTSLRNSKSEAVAELRDIYEG